MLELMDWFCGAGGSSQGAAAVPDVICTRAANHWDQAVESHAANFPYADHYLGDIRKAPVHKWPVAHLFWASPECPQWSSARGKKRDYTNTLQGDLFDTPRDAEADRSRALMEEVPQYLRGVIDRGGRVLAGVVENVVEVRAWDQWDRWIAEIRNLGYRIRVIALSSMHAQPARTLPAPQSRDRLYVAYWDAALCREPDWDKWLRPRAFCPTCDEWVDAIQVFKRPGADMGRYKQQYTYRCPHVSCRNTELTPPAMPAIEAIDWSLPGTPIGERKRPLKEKTLIRVRAGIERYWGPLIVEAAGNTYDAADPHHPAHGRTDGYYRSWPVGDPLRTVHTTSSKALAVPVEGRDGKTAAPLDFPLRTMTSRNETGLVLPPWRTPGIPAPAADGLRVPFVAELRGGSSDARAVVDPLATVTASGNHHALVTSYYRNGSTLPVSAPLATVTTVDRHALLMRNNGVRGGHPARHTTPASEPARTITTAGHQSLITAAQIPIDLDSVLFRMLEPHEIGRAMAFRNDYVVLGNKRQRVRQYGNAVTPPVAEIIISALVEAITGESLERYPNLLAA